MAALNGWVDENGRRYVIYPKSEMIEDMRATRYRVDLALSELYATGKMVVVTQPNPGRPCRIYVKDITENFKEEKETEMENMNTENKGLNFLIMDKHGQMVLKDFLECVTCVNMNCHERKERFLSLFDYMNSDNSEEDILFYKNEMNDEAALEDTSKEEATLNKVRENFEKKRFEELFKRKMIDSQGKPNDAVIQLRSAVLANEIAMNLKRLENRAVIHTDKFINQLMAGWNNDDYDFIYITLSCMQDLFSFPIGIYDDLFWIGSGNGDTYVERTYKDFFMKELGCLLEKE